MNDADRAAFRAEQDKATRLEIPRGVRNDLKISLGAEQAANVATSIVCATLSAIGSHIPPAEGIADYWETIFWRLV